MASPATTPAAEEVRALVSPSAFLSLAPATSSSYPQPKKAQPVDAAAAPEIKRRSSSLSSDDTKNTTSRRFLKLGPVHWGEHLDNSQGDWHEAAIE